MLYQYALTLLPLLADGVAIRQAQDERPGDTPTEAA